MTSDDARRERIAALVDRHHRAAHAMQTAVAIDKQRHGPEGEKHLRVGINAAMADHSGLATLLIKKGLITEEEYLTAIAESMEREVERYRRHLHLPDHVSLG